MEAVIGWGVIICWLAFATFLPLLVLVTAIENVKSAKSSGGQRVLECIWALFMGLLLWSLGPIPAVWVLVERYTYISKLVLLMMVVFGVAISADRRASRHYGPG